MKKLIFAGAFALLGLVGRSAFADPAGGPSVTVVNPPTSPAITSSIDDPGRTPYQFLGHPTTCTGPECYVYAPPVPAGKRLVIQHVSTYAALANSGSAFYAALQIAQSGLILSAFTSPLIYNGTQSVGDHALQAYVDGGSTPVLFMTTDGLFTHYTFVSITGYLLDCTVNRCASIAP